MPPGIPIDHLVGNWRIRAQRLAPLAEHLHAHNEKVSQLEKQSPLHSDPLITLSFPSYTDRILTVHHSRLAISGGPLLSMIRPNDTTPSSLQIQLTPSDSPTVFNALVDFLYCSDIILSRFTLHQCALIAQSASHYHLYDLSSALLAYIRLQNLLVSDQIFNYINLTQLPNPDTSFATYYHKTATSILKSLPLSDALIAVQTLLSSNEHHIPITYTFHIIETDALSTPEALLLYLPVLNLIAPPAEPLQTYLASRYANHYEQITALMEGRIPSATTSSFTPSSMWALLSSTFLTDPIIRIVCANSNEKHIPRLLFLILTLISPFVSDRELGKLVSYVPIPPWRRTQALMDENLNAVSPRVLRIAAAAMCTQTSGAYFSLPVHVLLHAWKAGCLQHATVLQALDITVQYVQSGEGMSVHILGKKLEAQLVTERRVRYFIHVAAGECLCGSNNLLGRDLPLGEVGADVKPGQGDFEIQIGLLSYDDCQKWLSVHQANCSILLTLHVLLQRDPTPSPRGSG